VRSGRGARSNSRFRRDVLVPVYQPKPNDPMLCGWCGVKAERLYVLQTAKSGELIACKPCAQDLIACRVQRQVVT
jgi:hypothetical protein